MATFRFRKVLWVLYAFVAGFVYFGVSSVPDLPAALYSDFMVNSRFFSLIGFGFSLIPLWCLLIERRGHGGGRSFRDYVRRYWSPVLVGYAGAAYMFIWRQDPGMMLEECAGTISSLSVFLLCMVLWICRERI